MEVSGGKPELARYAQKDTGRKWLTTTAGEAVAESLRQDVVT
jgi:hypothetical protein